MAAGLGDRGLAGRLCVAQFFSVDTNLVASRGFGSVRVGSGPQCVERSHPAPPPRGEVPGLRLPPRPKSEDRDMGTRGAPGRAVPGLCPGRGGGGKPRGRRCQLRGGEFGQAPGSRVRWQGHVRLATCLVLTPDPVTGAPPRQGRGPSNLSALCWPSPARVCGSHSLCAEHGPGCPLRTAHRPDRRGVCQRPGPSHAPFLGAAAVITEPALGGRGAPPGRGTGQGPENSHPPAALPGPGGRSPSGATGGGRLRDLVRMWLWHRVFKKARY